MSIFLLYIHSFFAPNFIYFMYNKRGKGKDLVLCSGLRDYGSCRPCYARAVSHSSRRERSKKIPYQGYFLPLYQNWPVCGREVARSKIWRAASLGNIGASLPPRLVLTQPGWTEETRMLVPSCLSLTARVRVYMFRAAFDIL